VTPKSKHFCTKRKASIKNGYLIWHQVLCFIPYLIFSSRLSLKLNKLPSKYLQNLWNFFDNKVMKINSFCVKTTMCLFNFQIKIHQIWLLLKLIWIFMVSKYFVKTMNKVIILALDVFIILLFSTLSYKETSTRFV
jgi:hypothetical protein